MEFMITTLIMDVTFVKNKNVIVVVIVVRNLAVLVDGNVKLTHVH
jgi:hypothetical protein